ncbi:MAG TPA: hypothetical protein VF070_09580 [Streptosporangiaceae bacterium]
MAADEMFAADTRLQLDETSWVDHVQDWLADDGELMEMLTEQAAWEQRSRWMYTRMVAEPRLTAEDPVIAEAPQPVLRYLAGVLSACYGRPYISGHEIDRGRRAADLHRYRGAGRVR